MLFVMITILRGMKQPGESGDELQPTVEPVPTPAPPAPTVPHATMEDEAFKQELITHIDSMYRLGLSLTRNARDAEDLAQEALARALDRKHQFRAGTNMRAWLLAIVRNTFINRYRRQRKQPNRIDFDEVEPFLTDPSEWKDEARRISVRDLENLDKLAEQLDEEIKRALDELSDEFRETFLLAVVEELSYKDIAEILAVPVGTVMSRLFRARKQMQAKLENYALETGWRLETETPTDSRCTPVESTE